MTKYFTRHSVSIILKVKVQVNHAKESMSQNVKDMLFKYILWLTWKNNTGKMRKSILLLTTRTCHALVWQSFKGELKGSHLPT